MTTSQKLHRLAAALFVGGLLLFLTATIRGLWDGAWVLAIAFIIGSLWLTAWVDLRDAGAAYRAAVDELNRDS